MAQRQQESLRALQRVLHNSVMRQKHGVGRKGINLHRVLPEVGIIEFFGGAVAPPGFLFRAKYDTEWVLLVL